MLQSHQIKALRLFDIHTRGSFDAFRLAGPAAVADRQTILSTLTQSKLPRAKCGVTELWDKFAELAREHGARDEMNRASCRAVREDVFRDWARDQIIRAADREGVPQ